MTSQLTFFQTPSQPRLPNESSIENALRKISWSYSRRSTLTKCVRSYYYEYYGANKRTAKEDPNKSIISQLKALQNRHERTGQILHLAIGVYLRKARSGDAWEPARLVTWACDILRKDINYSQAHPDGSGPPIENYPPVLLSEFFHRDPDAFEICEGSIKRLADALISFTGDPCYQPFRSGSQDPEAIIETPFKTRNLLPCRIDGRVDLAYSTNATVSVVDWKLGADDGTSDDSLQLGSYALWAIDHYKCSPQSIRICKAHLGSKTIVEFRINDGLLSAVRSRIIQDAEGMLLLHPFGERAIIDAFTPCAHPKICGLCSYSTICPEGKEVLNA